MDFQRIVNNGDQTKTLDHFFFDWALIYFDVIFISLMVCCMRCAMNRVFLCFLISSGNSNYFLATDDTSSVYIHIYSDNFIVRLSLGK